MPTGPVCPLAMCCCEQDLPGRLMNLEPVALLNTRHPLSYVSPPPGSVADSCLHTESARKLAKVKGDCPFTFPNFNNELLLCPPRPCTWIIPSGVPAARPTCSTSLLVPASFGLRARLPEDSSVGPLKSSSVGSQSFSLPHLGYCVVLCQFSKCFQEYTASHLSYEIITTEFLV